MLAYAAHTVGRRGAGVRNRGGSLGVFSSPVSLLPGIGAGAFCPSFGHDVERFLVEALAVADFTIHVHVGEKAHFHPHGPVPLARLAPSSGEIEGKTTGLVSPGPGLRGHGEETADFRKEPHVGGGHGSGSVPDGAVVHFQDPVDSLPSVDSSAGAGRILPVEKNGVWLCSNVRPNATRQSPTNTAANSSAITAKRKQKRSNMPKRLSCANTDVSRIRQN